MSRFLRITLFTLLMAAIVFFGFRASQPIEVPAPIKSNGVVHIEQKKSISDIDKTEATMPSEATGTSTEDNIFQPNLEDVSKALEAGTDTTKKGKGESEIDGMIGQPVIEEAKTKDTNAP